ncbi:LacI family DNA-binding transcriptional regulator [Saccharopolyspora erythraea]|uniref:LacI family DNA-binding transcriptional regulator n=1 Tax=Saccharopolyspora erythraea TaxID=1836 RepID=UPI001BA8C7CB|nr:LacI family DNA-binding transcriptional regulator [Saccharopolyspora erythraea]QUH01830.1 LacI family DNA-binding transcriptional regulator [Saccharopolyspora erythraea]
MARLAGVSTAVVSYVLNDGPRPVSAATKERVLAAIAELGYRRDAVARNLRTGKTQSLGLVVPDIGLPYFGAITQQLVERAFEAGHQMLICTTSWLPDRERAQLASLAERRVDGVVLMSVDPLQDFSAVEELGIPTVVIDRPEVAVRGAHRATAHLVAHGHERIGFVGAAERLVASRRRREGWAAALRGSGLPSRPELIRHGPCTRAGGYVAAGELLALAEPPTAVFVESDAQAVGLLRAARDHGFRVPDDLAVASGEGTELAEFAIPSLTTLYQPIATIAREAVAAVLATEGGTLRRLDNQEFDLVCRESCGCADALQ